ncbi:hypothetical protein EON80_28625 [bacterium]|nr:MAG: hypothetical protein EON80_28625 [bacterium]
MEDEPATSHPRKESVAIPLPYVLKPSRANWFGMLIPTFACLGVIIACILGRQWGGVVIFGPLVVGSVLLIVVYVSRRIELDGEGFRMTGTFQSVRALKYEDIEKIEMSRGGKVSFLKVTSKGSRPSLRIGLTPFSNREWSKFIQIVAERSPLVVLDSAAERWRRGHFY